MIVRADDSTYLKHKKEQKLVQIHTFHRNHLNKTTAMSQSKIISPRIWYVRGIFHKKCLANKSRIITAFIDIYYDV